MAGGRIRLVHVVNRTCAPLDCMFDGVPDVVPAGYKRVEKPRVDAKGELVMKGGKPVVDVEFVGAGPNGEPLSYPVEYAAAEAYKRQHPIMGTSDPTSVDAKDTDYLLGIVEWEDDIDHAEQSDAIELIDRSMLGDDRQDIRAIRVAGARRGSIPAGVITDRKVKANKRRHAVSVGLSADNNSPSGLKTSL